MAGVDFDSDFPQPPKPGTAPAKGGAPVGRRFRFRDGAQVEIELLHPLISEDGSHPDVERLSIRRITAGEMIEVVEGIGSDAGDEELIRHVMAAMAGVDIDVLAALSPDDAGRVAAAALPFMPGGLVAAIERASTTAETTVTADAA